MEKEAEQAVVEATPPTCSVCNKPLMDRIEHQVDGECALANAQPNTHKLTKGDLRLYKPEHHMMVLTHGRQMFAFAFNIYTTNQACNHWQQISQKYMHMRPPTARMIENYDWLLHEALAAHGWTIPDVMPLVEELAKVQAEAGSRLIVPTH